MKPWLPKTVAGLGAKVEAELNDRKEESTKAEAADDEKMRVMKIGADAAKMKAKESWLEPSIPGGGRNDRRGGWWKIVADAAKIEVKESWLEPSIKGGHNEVDVITSRPKP